MIPKKIHYCWFGRNEKSGIIKQCIQSWRDKLPDYEIIEWNEDNLDVVGTCEEDYVSIMEKKEQEGWLTYHVYQKDVKPFIEACHCFVLRSCHGMSGWPSRTWNVQQWDDR